VIRVAFVIGGYPPEEHKRRADVALSYPSAEVEVGIVDMAASPYFYGMTPTEIQLVAPAFIESFRRAEREGYDAVVPLGMLDLGVDGGKSAVDIPVVGPTEACLHVASLIGDQFGLMVYHEDMVAYSRAIVRRYGMLDRVVGFGTSGFDLPDLAAHHDEVVGNFVGGETAHRAGGGGDHPDGHRPVPGAHQPPVAAGAARRAGGQGVRPADPHGRAAGEPGPQTEPRPLAALAHPALIGATPTSWSSRASAAIAGDSSSRCQLVPSWQRARSSWGALARWQGEVLRDGQAPLQPLRAAPPECRLRRTA